MRFPHRFRLPPAAGALLLAIGGLLPLAAAAGADEIRFVDPKKCEPAVLTVAEVTRRRGPRSPTR